MAEQEKLTAELEAALDAAVTLAEIEDLYRPYRPKRRTRATAAREKGLAPLAARLLQQNLQDPAPEALAAAYCDAEKGVETPGDALAGASDILAEQLTDDAALRKQLRAYLLQEGVSDPPEQAELIYRLRNTGDTGSLLAEPFWSVTAGGKEYTLSAVTGQALQNVEIA